jgi:hypothetical protein
VTWPAGLPTRQCSLGPDFGVVTGADYGVDIDVTMSRSYMTWGPTGAGAVGDTKTISIEPGQEQTFALVPTDLDGWYVDGMPVDMSGGKPSHVYTLDIKPWVYDARNAKKYARTEAKLTNLVIPSGDGVLDLDKATSVSGAQGGTVTIPDLLASLRAEVDAYKAELEAVAAAPTDAFVAARVADDASETAGALDARIAGQAAPLPGPANVGYEVVLLIGQSNMAGGDTDTIDHVYLDPITPRINQYATYGSYKGQIIAGADGLFHAFGQSLTVGPGTPFARNWLPWLPANRSILLVPSARGNTGFTVGPHVDTWDPANTTPGVTNLYATALANADAALAAAGPNSRLAAVLWLQGENDAQAGMDQATYAAHLDAVIDGVRAHFGNPELPFIVGQMVPSYISSHAAQFNPINAAHVDTIRRKYHTAFVYGSNLPPNPASGGIHYSAAGARAMGPAWADALVRFAPANIPGTPPVAPSGVNLTQNDGTSLTALWIRTPGRVTDYRVEYQVNGGAWTSLNKFAVSASLTGLPAGATVAVRVSTINELGTSAPCPTATLTLATAPGQVTGVTLGSASDKTQPLSWTAVAGATKYVVEYGTHNSGTWTTAATVTGTSATVSGLTASTSYDYRVTAQNIAGSGTPSATVTGSTTAAPPAMNVDSLGTPAFAALSLRKVVSNYTGPAIQVRRSNDNATQDIGFDSSGNLDMAALQAFVGSASGYVATWYDQSGNARHFTQATPANQPVIVNAGLINAVNGRPMPAFSAVNLTALTRSSIGVYAAGATTMLTVMSTTTPGVVPFSESNLSGGQARYVPLYLDNSAHMSELIRPDSGSFLTMPTSSTSVPTNGSLHQMSTVDTGSAFSQYLDATATVNAAAYTRSGTFAQLAQMGIGAFVASNPTTQLGVTGSIAEVIIVTSALSDSVRQAGQSDQKLYYGTP